jgi:hypothetical protein
VEPLLAREGSPDVLTWWDDQRFPAWAYLHAGDLENAEKVAREGIAAGRTEDWCWINDIAVRRGRPSAPRLMQWIAGKKVEERDLFDWYHIGREAAAAGDEKTALDALRRACEFWRNPPLYDLPVWEKDTRWGPLREHPEFKRIIAEKRRRIGPIYGQIWYFPMW